jgi:hypothetical protein
VSLALVVPASGAIGTTSSAAVHRATVGRASASDTVLDWQQAAIEVVYLRQPQPAPIPTGVLTLGFTSLAMHDAVKASLRRRNSSERAAVTIAAFRVLAEYVPNQNDYLLDARTASLDAIGPGPAKRLGIRIGRAAAQRMIRSRVHDGRELAGNVVYQRADAPGVWQPDPPATAMAFAHLGFVDPLVLRSRIRLDGPDALDSAAYARDFNEVKALGSSTPPAPGDEAAAKRIATAKFFNYNSAAMMGSATIEHLRDHPMRMLRTTRLFAVMHGAMTDSVIATFRLKYQVGFWRPRAAIRRATEDGNAGTATDATWEPLLPNPAYSDYVSGHAGITAPAAEVLRRLLGNRTALDLENPVTGEHRTYATLSALESDALNSRVWGGFHFRDAMDDGYLLGHRTARQVLRLVG